MVPVGMPVDVGGAVAVPVGDVVVPVDVAVGLGVVAVAVGRVWVGLVGAMVGWVAVAVGRADALTVALAPTDALGVVDGSAGAAEGLTASCSVDAGLELA